MGDGIGIFFMKILKITNLVLSFVTHRIRRIFYENFFHRKHDKKIDLKAFERPTVSTILIPKHLYQTSKKNS